MSETKTCRKCGVCKPVGEFYPGKARCKPCFSEALRLSQNKDRKREADRLYRLTNRDRINSRLREWGAANAEHQRKKAKAWRKTNPDRRRTKALIDYHKSREQLSDGYLRNLLTQQGIPRSVVSQTVIDLKREHLSLHRLAKSLQGAANKAKDQS